jgi:hypothetical protein
VSAVRTDRRTRGATIRLVLVPVVNRTAPGGPRSPHRR